MKTQPLSCIQRVRQKALRNREILDGLQIFFDIVQRFVALVVPSLLLRDMRSELSDIELATESDINFIIFK